MKWRTSWYDVRYLIEFHPDLLLIIFISPQGIHFYMFQMVCVGKSRLLPIWCILNRRKSLTAILLHVTVQLSVYAFYFTDRLCFMHSTLFFMALGRSRIDGNLNLICKLTLLLFTLWRSWFACDCCLHSASCAFVSSFLAVWALVTWNKKIFTFLELF